MRIVFFILITLLPLFSAETLFQQGENLYKETCVSCHGENGETNKAIHFVVKPRKLQKTLLTQQQSYKIIMYGAHYFGAHADIMPSFQYVYTPQQIHALAFYITHKFHPYRDKEIAALLKNSIQLTPQQKQNRLAVGKKIFERKCALCHGINGDGNSDYVKGSKGEHSFIYPYNLQRTLLHEDQIFLYAKYGGHYFGTDKQDMPAWGKKYDDVALKSVAYYITKVIKKLDQ